jgi:integrase/recombinase XerD
MPSRIDWTRVAALWTASGRTSRTVATYVYRGRRFEAQCRKRGYDPVTRLTRQRASSIAGACGLKAGSKDMLVGAARALSYALAALGLRVPKWSPARRAPRRPRIVDRFVRHRLRYRGVTEKTALLEANQVTPFLKFLAARRRNARTVRLVDVDAFVLFRSKTYAIKTVYRVCAALRAFLRYLHMIGLLGADLSAHVAPPKLRSVDRPPRALPWNDVRRILRAIDVTAPLGLRDKALFLMMATYGMGAAEVNGLCLDDIDWRSRRLRVRRCKTGVVTELPLLDPVARALATYLRRGRPAHAVCRCVFVSSPQPHTQLGAPALHHRLALYAERAGVRNCYLGTHLRQSGRRHSGPSPPGVDVGVHAERDSSAPRSRTSGASMSTALTGPFAKEIDAFLEFKRARGNVYETPARILRDFDRFAAARYPKRTAHRLPEIVEAWLTREGKRKPVTIEGYYCYLRQFCLFRQRRDANAFVPPRAYPSMSSKKFVPRILSRRDIQDIVRRASALGCPAFRGSLYRALVLVLYCTGMRLGEPLRLRIRDVDVDGQLMFVARSKGRARWVPFHKSLAPELHRYLRARRAHARARPDDRFFVGVDRKGLPVDRLLITTVCFVIRRLLRKAGLKPAKGRVGPRPYDLRHAFAVHRLERWYRAGVDLHARLPELSAYMGHDNILGTEKYLHATPWLLHVAARRLRRRLARRRTST